jgi:hypothetical protein
VYLKIGDVFEYEWVADSDLSSDFIVHGVDVCLVNGHALLCEGARVVNGDVVEFRMRSPIFI